MNNAFDKILERLEEVENRLLNESGDIGCTLGITNMSEYSKQIIQEVAEEYNGGWIPCSERLPEENKDGWTHLILSIKTGEVIFGFWHNEEMGFCKHFRDGVCRVCGVIAWMPLPEPFKERD